MQSVVLKISVQLHTLLHVHVIVKRLLQKQTLLLMIIKIILIPNGPVRCDNWITVCVLLLQALRQAGKQALVTASSLDILLLFRRYS